jgi:hypothetical protein
MISVSPSGQKRKVGDSNPHDPKVARFSGPARRAISDYLPLISVDPPRVELGSPPRQSGVFPLDHEPEVDRMGIEPTTPTLQGSVAPDGMQAQYVERSVRELNPVFRPTKAACCRNTYRPCAPSDPGWNRTTVLLVVTQASLPLDHGIVLSVTEAGFEPAKSRGSRPRRFASLRTRPWRVRVSHPAGGAYEAPLSTGPPAVAGPGNDPGTPAS